MPFYSETEKIYEKVKPYLGGTILDMGCGTHKITPDAIGIDGRQTEDAGIVTDRLSDFPESMHGMADVVFSSHCLEHMLDDYGTLLEWAKLLKPKGYLILYLPDGRRYNNYMNPEHMRDYTYPQFMLFFERAFCGQGKNFRGETLPLHFSVIESGQDFGDDRYSFYLVAQKQ